MKNIFSIRAYEKYFELITIFWPQLLALKLLIILLIYNNLGNMSRGCFLKYKKLFIMVFLQIIYTQNQYYF
jgi:hypothetical protein